MLTTAMTLGEGAQDDGAKAASWRQIVDILAQGGATLDPRLRERALAMLTAARSGIAASERRFAATSLAARTSDAGIVELFANDAPGVAAPMLARVALDVRGWLGIVPAMPPAARNILRNRRDLPPEVVTMLARFAPGDLALPTTDPVATVPQPVVAPGGATAIRELVDRIAAYRERVPAVGPGAEPAAPAQADRFVFETTAEGLIDWIEGAPREAIAGIAIGDMAALTSPGVDGQAAGAVRRRAPFRDARLLVGGEGPTAGDWLISAAPLFNPRSGRFCGYRGEARRPLPGERVGGASPAGGIAPDSLRQLVHELRTPLNAIQGFAQMIDQQMLGPAAQRYRDRARAIIADAERLTAMVDDLDTAARVESGRMPVEDPESADIAAVVASLVATHRQPLAVRGVELALTRENGPLPVDIALSTAERMIARLMSATCSVATPGETIDVDLRASDGHVALSVSRPSVLDGRDERTLLDPGYGPDGDWPDAPLLGLGFTLRLVARLAAQAGGKLSIRDDRFALLLPVQAGQAAMVGPAGLEPAT